MKIRHISYTAITFERSDKAALLDKILVLTIFNSIQGNKFNKENIMSHYFKTISSIAFFSIICIFTQKIIAAEIGYLSNEDGDIELYITINNHKKRTQITHNVFDDMEPCSGPEGNWLAVITRSQTSKFIQVLDKQGNKIKKIEPEVGFPSSLACFSDKDEIAYSVNSNTQHTIFITSIKSTNLVPIYTSPNTILDLKINQADSHLAFSEQVGRTSVLHIFDLAKKQKQTYFDKGKYVVAEYDWAPNNNNMMVSVKHQKQFDLWEINLSDKAQRLWTELPTIDTSPKYSPDGNKIAWLSNRVDGTRLQLFVSDLRAPKPIALTESGIEVRDPVWDPTSTALLYSAYRNNQFGLYQLSLSSNIESQLYPVEGKFQIMPFFLTNDR